MACRSSSDSRAMLSSLRTSGWSVSVAAAFTARPASRREHDASLSHRRLGQSADDPGTMRLTRMRVANIWWCERITFKREPSSFPDDQPGKHEGDRGRGGIIQVEPVLRFHENLS